MMKKICLFNCFINNNRIFEFFSLSIFSQFNIFLSKILYELMYVHTNRMYMKKMHFKHKIKFTVFLTFSLTYCFAIVLYNNCSDIHWFACRMLQILLLWQTVSKQCSINRNLHKQTKQKNTKFIAPARPNHHCSGT